MGHSARTHDSEERQSQIPQLDCLPSGLDLLVVDPDEQRSVHLVREVSELLTVRVAEKSSGREALAGISRARFDAVIVSHEHVDHINGLKSLENPEQVAARRGKAA